jgi:hypothetical protein
MTDPMDANGCRKSFSDALKRAKEDYFGNFWANLRQNCALVSTHFFDREGCGYCALPFRGFAGCGQDFAIRPEYDTNSLRRTQFTCMIPNSLFREELPTQPVQEARRA